jgi:hypothetical protein
MISPAGVLAMSDVYGPDFFCTVFPIEVFTLRATTFVSGNSVIFLRDKDEPKSGS